MSTEPCPATFWFSYILYGANVQTRRYASKEAFDAHCVNPKLGEALRKAAEEDLVVGEPTTEVLERVAGFNR